MINLTVGPKKGETGVLKIFTIHFQLTNFYLKFALFLEIFVLLYWNNFVSLWLITVKGR